MSFDNTKTEAEALAESVMNVTDWRKMEAEGLTAREYFTEQHGVDPAKHDSESELRADPRTQAINELDARFGPHSAERENVLKLYDAIRGSERVGESELERKQVFRVSEDALDVLADLRGIEREVKRPPEPEDISIETYADVLAAQETIEQADGPEVVWRSTDA